MRRRYLRKSNRRKRCWRKSASIQTEIYAWTKEY